jgi:hypothetical protein
MAVITRRRSFWDEAVNVNEPEPGFLLGRGHGRGLVHGQ